VSKEKVKRQNEDDRAHKTFFALVVPFYFFLFIFSFAPGFLAGKRSRLLEIPAHQCTSRSGGVFELSSSE